MVRWPEASAADRPDKHVIPSHHEHQQQAVADENYRDDGSSELNLRIPKSDLLRILSTESLALDKLTWVAEGNRP